MIHILVLFWAVIAFTLLCDVVYFFSGHSRRSSFIIASLFSGLYLYTQAEVLSFFNLLVPKSFWLFCGFASIFILYFWLQIPKGQKLNFLKVKVNSFKNVYVCFLLCILAGTFFQAVAYPPNTWDSMTYHLPRIEHWIQNGNLDFYPTSIERQLISAPFAEIAILYGRILTGSDYLMNIVQWFSFLGSLIVVSKIVANLGLNRKCQLVSVLFLGTLPIVILEASSTQTDLVLTFWTLCAVERLQTWIVQKRSSVAWEFGVALGLAILTKGSAYVILFPFVLAFVFFGLRRYKKLLLPTVVAGLLCLLINAPHYIRSYKSYNTPIVSHYGTVSNLGITSFALATFGNIYSNIPIPVCNADNINKKLQHLGSDIFPYGVLRVHSVKSKQQIMTELFSYHEDTVKNSLHTSLILFSFVIIFVTRTSRNIFRYGILCALSWLLFFYLIPWQPWIVRLQVPLFGLSAVIFAVAWSSLKWKTLRIGILLVMCVTSLLPLLFNYSRPIKSIGRGVPYINMYTSYISIWNSDRERLMFSNLLKLYPDYKNIQEMLTQKNVRNVGLVIDGDAWEYPLWVMLRNSKNRDIQITHLNINNISPCVDYVVMINNAIVREKYGNLITSADEAPNILLLERQGDTSSEWIPIYPH